MTIKDTGPKPQSFDIETATKENRDYRSVAWSGRYLQVTLMSIPVGGDIGLEAHPETDQFLRLDAGHGRVRMEEERANRLQAIDANLTTRGLRLAGDARGADLAAFDNTAREEVRQLRETLFQLGMEGTADYADRILRLEQTLAAERLSIVERYADQQRAIASTARGLLEQLTIGELGGLAPETRYFAGLQALNAARGTLADGATQEEVADFARLAQAVLPIARDFLGTSDRYAGLRALPAGRRRRRLAAGHRHRPAGRWSALAARARHGLRRARGANDP